MIPGQLIGGNDEFPPHIFRIRLCLVHLIRVHSLHPDLPELNGTELRLDWTHSAVISPLSLLTPDWDRSA
ncbi:hypothetical protein BVRB_8g195810 [Beta vulgaris subsp. vulgaris]|nr:hypothetical protein BVRB_8g195810 [Beta vulgaris subsp. vulgaris]